MDFNLDDEAANAREKLFEIVPKDTEESEDGTTTTDEERSALVGHGVVNTERSEDVLLCGNDVGVDFSKFKLSDEIKRGLMNEGFENPSPIQLGAIPYALTGCDMLLQSKSGTGKTCVFSVVALERVSTKIDKIQILILCPCREIAVQTQDVIKLLGAFKEGLLVETFIGGRPVGEDLNKMPRCHIAVGTPGRFSHLIRDHELDLSGVVLFVMDEVDKLFEGSFSTDVGLVTKSLPSSCQILAVSATFEDGVEKSITHVLKEPVVKIIMEIGGKCLLGVEQYSLDVKEFYNFEPEEGQSVKIEEINILKLRALIDILHFLQYSQVIIFCSFQLKAMRVYDDLRRAGIDVALLSGALSQSLRVETFRRFKREKCDVLVATDLAARGLDYEGVNLVVNYESPIDLATYIHRMGRSGRFGSFGRVITLLGFNSDTIALRRFQNKARLDINIIKNTTALKKLGTKQLRIDFDASKKRSTENKFRAPKEVLSTPGALTLAEAWEYLEDCGGEELFYAATSVTKLEIEEENIDPDALIRSVERIRILLHGEGIEEKEYEPVAELEPAKELEPE